MMEKVEAKLAPAQMRILRALTDVYPAARDKVELAACVGASTTSSSFTNSLGRLRTLD